MIDDSSNTPTTAIVANLKCEADARISVLGQVIWLLRLDRVEPGRAFSCFSAPIRAVKVALQ